MMANLRNLLSVFLIVIFWTMPVFAKSFAPDKGSQGKCGERQSCIPVKTNMSHIIPEAAKMTIAEVRLHVDFSLCTSGHLSVPIEDTIDICEAVLKSGTGTIRERATVMFVLGHAYMRTPDAFQNTTGPNESKTIKIWNEASRIDPTYIEPLLSSALMFSIYGELAQAQDAFDRAEKIDSRDWRIYTGRVIVFSRAQIISGMIEAADKAMLLNPDEPEVRRVYAMALFSRNQFEDAAKQYKIAALNYANAKISTLEMVHEENPWISLANVYRVMGKPLQAADAMTSYIESLRAEERSYQLYQWRAEYLELAGLYAKAADDYGIAASRAPKQFAESLTTKRAMLMAQSGSKVDASKDLQAILERGSLRPILKVQVFLRNQGYADVTINGHYDAATKRALDTCLHDNACAPGVGRAI